MGRDRGNPSGIPSRHAIEPVYGLPAHDPARGVEAQHAGMLRVRRTFLIATALVGALAALVAIFGNADSASGIAVVMLVPLLVLLAGAHLTVLLSRPSQHPPKNR